MHATDVPSTTVQRAVLLVVTTPCTLYRIVGNIAQSFITAAAGSLTMVIAIERSGSGSITDLTDVTFTGRDAQDILWVGGGRVESGTLKDYLIDVKGMRKLQGEDEIVLIFQMTADTCNLGHSLVLFDKAA